MKKEHAGTTGGVIHCFSGSAEMAKEYVKMGYYIGVGGVVTFKNSRVIKGSGKGNFFRAYRGRNGLSLSCANTA